MASKKKQVKKVVISAEHYDILGASRELLSSVFGSGTLSVSIGDFKEYARLEKLYDKLDPDTVGPDDYVPPKEESK